MLRPGGQRSATGWYLLPPPATAGTPAHTSLSGRAGDDGPVVRPCAAERRSASQQQSHPGRSAAIAGQRHGHGHGHAAPDSQIHRLGHGQCDFSLLSPPAPPASKRRCKAQEAPHNLEGLHATQETRPPSKESVPRAGGKGSRTKFKCNVGTLPVARRLLPAGTHATTRMTRRRQCKNRIPVVPRSGVQVGIR